VSEDKAARPDASMTLIAEMMQSPLDPGYYAAAENRQRSGLPPAIGHRSPLLVLVAVLIGALLTTSAMALRVPATGGNTIKSDLVRRIEARRAHTDAQTRLIAGLRREIDAAQASALSQQSQTVLAAELSRLELAAGTVPVTGPGLVLTVDNAAKKVDSNNPVIDPRISTEFDKGKVYASDLQIIVNGLWKAGAEAISVNGHRLTSRSAIRFAGEAILVDYRPLTRPYVITAIGDPGTLNVEFADNEGGIHLHSLTNYKIRSDIQDRDSVLVPGEPTLSLQKAQPVQSAVTKKASQPTPSRATRSTPTRSTPTRSTPTRTTAPQTTETTP
jgi:uncharacterized protein YlxW (UPF0749 family)